MKMLYYYSFPAIYLEYLKLSSTNIVEMMLRNYPALLTHFSPVSHFYTPFGFLTFSGGIEMWHWTKMG